MMLNGAITNPRPLKSLSSRQVVHCIYKWVMDELVRLVSGPSVAALVVVEVEDNVLSDDFCYEEALRLLPLGVQARVNAKKVAHDRYITLSNRILQSCVAQLVCGGRDVSFHTGKYGKPYLDDPNVSFSMTNGEQYVCMFVVRAPCTSGMDVGIDIASTNDFKCEDDLEIYRDVLADEEYSAIQEACLGDMKSKFAFYWSIKESYTKYLGVGLNFDLKSIDGSGSIPPTRTGSGYTENRILDLIFKSFWVDDEEIVSYCYLENTAENLSPKVFRLRITDIIDYMKTNKEMFH